MTFKAECADIVRKIYPKPPKEVSQALATTKQEPTNNTPTGKGEG